MWRMCRLTVQISLLVGLAWQPAGFSGRSAGDVSAYITLIRTKTEVIMKRILYRRGCGLSDVRPNLFCVWQRGGRMLAISRLVRGSVACGWVLTIQTGLPTKVCQSGK